MASGDRIIIGFLPGQFIPQGDASFQETEWGFDTGTRKWLTHPGTPKDKWPQRGEPDKVWPKMFVREVVPRDDESGLVELTATYRGVMRYTDGIMKERLTPGSPVAMFSLPALSSGEPVRIVAPIPKPQVTREYVTLTKPSLQGVSQNVAGTWLPLLPGFSISYIPDPDEPLSVNYGNGWKLDDRSWEDIAAQVWHVREFASYYYPIST